MNPEQLLKSIYLGDRGCKALLIDSWNRRILIQATLISRLQPGTDSWNFYSGGDIPDGWVVFTDAVSITFDPAGPIPNDLINEFKVKLLESGESRYKFSLSIDSVDESGTRQEIVVL